MTDEGRTRYYFCEKCQSALDPKDVDVGETVGNLTPMWHAPHDWKGGPGYCGGPVVVR